MSYQDFIRSKHVRVGEVGFAPSEMHNSLFDWQRAIVEWACRKGRAALFEDCGLGKALRVDQRILTPKGWKRIGDAVVGDLVFGSDGKPHQVTGVYPQGNRELRKVNFSDGTDVICDREHLWHVLSQGQLYKGRAGRVLTVDEIERIGLSYPGGQKKHFIPLSSPLDFSRNDYLPIDPYTLGVLIGDGCVVHRTPVITTPDEEIISNLVVPEGCIVSKNTFREDRCQSYSVIGGSHKNSKNPMKSILEGMGLYGKKSEDKFIPEAYKFSSPSSRLAILQGLLDTDGYCSGSCIEYSTSSSQLADDFIFIVRSLGGTATPSIEPSHYTNRGVRVECLEKHRMIVKLPPDMPAFRLSRKRNKHNPVQRKRPLKSIIGIELAGFGECVCIRVDAPDSLFITEGFTLTHNTRQQLEWARQVLRHTGRPVLILAPLAVGQQTVAEGIEIDLSVSQVRGQEEIKRPGVYVTNYEMMEHFKTESFGGVVLDESSILKAFMGKTKRLLVEMFSCVPYRLACTATPAPNDLCELGNHSEFLGLFSLQEMQSRWFVNDGFDAGSYRLKKHAAHDFWQWVGSWAVCIQTPDDLGFDGSSFVLPPLVTHQHVVSVDEFVEGQGTLVNIQKLSATMLHRELRETAAQRAEKVAALCNPSSSPWVIWCHTDAESDALMARIPDAVEVKGSMPIQKKIDNLAAFSGGQARVIVTKPKIAGWGLNWQHCARIATVGPSYSFESRYQAIRRCWRFGQKRQVEDHVVMTRRESAVFEVAQAKEAQHRSMADAMREVGHDLSVARRRELKEYRPIQTITLPSFITENNHAM